MKVLSKKQIIDRLAMFGILYLKDVKCPSFYGKRTTTGFMFRFPDKNIILKPRQEADYRNGRNYNIRIAGYYLVDMAGAKTRSCISNEHFTDRREAEFADVKIKVIFFDLFDRPEIEISKSFERQHGFFKIHLRPSNPTLERMSFDFCYDKLDIGIFYDAIKEELSKHNLWF